MSVTINPDLAHLTSAATDDQLQAAIIRNGLVREPIQAQVVQAHTHARMQRFAPVPALDYYFNNLARTIADLRRNNPSPGSRNAADWQCETKILRLSLEALEYFTAFAARWERMSDAQRMEERKQAESDASTRAFMQSAAHAAAMAPVRTFNPAHFLQLIDEARIRVTATPKGDLVVHNAGKLTAEQRMQLRTHKAEILQALGTTETF